MPRYFFDVRDGDTLITDSEGVDVPGMGAAAEEAKQAARDILAERVRHGEKVDQGVFEVLDDNGEPVLIVPFRSVLRLD